MPRDRLEVETRQNQALRLRREGLEYSDIATKLGYANHTGAMKAALAALNRQPAEDAPIVRQLELERLDALWRAAWRQLNMDHVLVSHGRVIEGVVDEGAKLAALDRLLRIQERRAKYLGLDEATKTRIDYVPEEVVDGEIERLRAYIAGRCAGREDAVVGGTSPTGS